MTSPIDTTEEPTILKCDGLGRVRMPVDRREALLDEFEKSGLSGAAFCRMTGVQYGTFANWVQARRKKRLAMGGAAPGAVLFGPDESDGSVRLLEAVVEGGSRLGADGGRAGLAIERQSVWMCAKRRSAA